MGGTFMFGYDNFDTKHDYYPNYQTMGGTGLDRKKVNESILYLFNEVKRLDRDPTKYECYPTMSALIHESSYFKSFTGQDKRIIEEIFAIYEPGTIPEHLKEILFKLSKSYRLGLISNVWSDSKYFIKILEDENLKDLFQYLLFSSDHNIIKPSPKLFQKAIDFFQLKEDEIVYIGNSYLVDVMGIKSVNGYSILVNSGKFSKITGKEKPDFVIDSLEELVK
jgi:FMN phosphatase YigB (HAD superfamily)